MTTHREPGSPDVPELPGAAHPRVEAPTTTLGEQETRENNGNTERGWRAILTRRRGLIAIAAAMGILAGGTITYNEINSQRKAAAIAPTPGSEGRAGGIEITPTVENRLPTGERVTGSRGVFSSELELGDIINPLEHGSPKSEGLPDPAEYSVDQTADDAIEALGKKLRYAINLGGPEGEKLIKESFNDRYQSATLNPTQFLARMDYIEYNRSTEIKRGLLEHYYAYGLELEVVDDTDISPRPEPGAETRLVKMRMGDYLPYEYDGPTFEPAHEQLVAIKVSDSANWIVHNKPTKSGGWEIVDIRPVKKVEGKYVPVYDNDFTKSGVKPLPQAYYDGNFTPPQRRDLEPIY